MKPLHGDEKFLSSGDYLSVVRDFALSKGIGPECLLRESEVDLQDLIHPPELVNNLVVNRVGLNLYQALANPLLGAFEFGLRMTIASHGALGLAVQCAENLAESYSILKDFYNTRINSQDVQIEEGEQDIRVHLVNKFQEDEMEPGVQRFFDLATLVSIATNTYQALDSRGLQGQLQLSIDATEPPDWTPALLPDVNVTFGEDALELRLPKAWKDAPLKIANRELAALARENCLQELQRLNPDDLVSRLKLRLQAREDVMPCLEEVAVEFYMSPATLKRKLKEYGKRYQDVKNEVRLERALALLAEEKHSIEDTAMKLGFSDASNFTKAFKAWTGKTPREFLNQA